MRKSPDDLDPSDVVEEQATFYFCTYDAEDVRNSLVTVGVKTGDKKTVQLEIEEITDGDE